MGLLLKSLFFLLSTIFLVVNSENRCPISYCGNNTFQIRHPFKLQGQQFQNCNYTDLKCISPQNIAVVNLLFSGDFNVRYIDYDSSTIALYDPNSCILKRLMNLSPKDYFPFKAKDFQTLTFYNCPLEASVWSNLTAIECMSNDTNAVVATISISRHIMEGVFHCSFISTSKIPFSSMDDGNLELTWDFPACKDCPMEKGGWRVKAISKFLAFIFMIPAIALLAFVLFVCTACCLQTVGNFTRDREYSGDDETAVARMRTLSTVYDTAMTSSTQPAIIGLDDSRIKSCSELVVFDISENVGVIIGEDYSCSICLEVYAANEKVRRINSCQHCFHSDCVERWLRNNSTCPICRVSLLDVIKL